MCPSRPRKQAPCGCGWDRWRLDAGQGHKRIGRCPVCGRPLYECERHVVLIDGGARKIVHTHCHHAALQANLPGVW